MNILSLRFVVFELLRGFVGKMVEYEDLVMFLNNILEKCVIHLRKELWNGLWIDMGIESTYIGITTNTCSVQTWVNDHHLCSDVLT